MENLRHGDTRTLRVVWDVPLDDDAEGPRAEEVFLPWPPESPPQRPTRSAMEWPKR
jgi:hypothetical protein